MLNSNSSSPPSCGSLTSPTPTSKRRRNESSSSVPSSSSPSSTKTNKFFLSFAFLCTVIGFININFHHLFHDEHVSVTSTREFSELHFQKSREEQRENYRKKMERAKEKYGLVKKGHNTSLEANNSLNTGSSSERNNNNAKNGLNKSGGDHKLAGLKCMEKYGGPEDDYAEKEMSFWSDIPSDATYKSPFLGEKGYVGGEDEKFLTFEPDHGGWNNIRMAMETALVMAHAMGRTLVLPPEQRFYLLGKDKEKNHFDFGDFFHLDSIAVEHEGFNVITMDEFLDRMGKSGKLNDIRTGKPAIYSGSKTFDYLRKVGTNPQWDPMKCIAAFPTTVGSAAIHELEEIHHNIMSGKDGRPHPRYEDFEGKPTPVDAPIEERMREMLAEREDICIYDDTLQNAKVIHFPAQKETRLLTHFYAFVFFADWKADLWSKRFVRDHLRYIDEIMCAAARVVQAVRRRSKTGLFDSMHVRRGDFQYKKTRLDADKLLEKSRDKLEEGGVLYIATDEHDKNFFQPFREHYDVVFLDDYKELLTGINGNYYGMLDQLIASKGRVFFGTWWSTLSGYVNRMRGYYIAKHKLEGYEDGTMESYYFFPDERKEQMKKYYPVKKPIYMREFPTSWLDIDKGIKEIHQQQ